MSKAEGKPPQKMIIITIGREYFRGTIGQERKKNVRCRARIARLMWILKEPFVRAGNNRSAILISPKMEQKWLFTIRLASLSDSFLLTQKCYLSYLCHRFVMFLNVVK